MPRIIDPNDTSSAKTKGGTKCRNNYTMTEGISRCRNYLACDGCYTHHVNFLEMRVGCEAFMSEVTWFVTLTYDDDHLSEADGTFPEFQFKQYIQNMRRMYGRIKYTACFEYGEKTGRPHYHAILFFLDQVPDIPLNLRADLPGWTKGYSCYEPPKTVNGMVKYTIAYLAKKGGVLLRPSNGLGKQYLINYAVFLARNKRPLMQSEYGIQVSVPLLSRKVKNPRVTAESRRPPRTFAFSGMRSLRKYRMPPSHHWGQLMADAYASAWWEAHGTEPDRQFWDHTSWTY